MQFQADILGIRVHKPECIETTAFGAACLAGLSAGFWKDKEELKKIWALSQTYEPNMSGDERQALLQGWHKAVKRSFAWER